MQTFTCSLCGFEAPFKYFAASLPSTDRDQAAGGACKTVFLEQGWLAVDPFAVQPHPLLLGSPCSVCARPVCTADTCSLFYAKRFCADCARQHAAAFPPAVLKASPRVFAGPARQPQQQQQQQ